MSALLTYRIRKVNPSRADFCNNAHLMQSDHAVALVVCGVPALRDAILKEDSGETYRRFDQFNLPQIVAGSSEAQLFERCLLQCAKAVGVQVDPTESFAERFLFAEHGQPGRAAKLAKNTLRRAVTKNRSHLSMADAEWLFLKNNGHMQMTPFHPGNWAKVKAELKDMGWAR